MGIPAFFRWVAEKYPKIVSEMLERRCQYVDGVAVPIDLSEPNPNEREWDNLYVDMNGLIHPCSHPEDRETPASEEEMYVNITKYVDRLFCAVRPRRLLFLAIDGVAPRAKMNQQRSRRFRAAKDAKEKQQIAGQVLDEMQAMGYDLPPQESEAWDSNVITPGTEFMSKLSTYIWFYILERINGNPAWKNIKVIFSDASEPGEGEHKIMHFIRSQRTQPGYDPNQRHILHGLDADLIMLALATHEPHFSILREYVAFGGRQEREKEPSDAKRLFDAQYGKEAALAASYNPQDEWIYAKPLVCLHINVLREYLFNEFRCLAVGGVLPFPFEFERILDDFVFMCFFVGNDFLPHLPSLDIRDGALDFLLECYKEILPSLGDYITSPGGNVNLRQADVILAKVAEVEDEVFRQRKYAEDAQERRKMQQKRIKAMGGIDAVRDDALRRHAIENNSMRAIKQSNPADSQNQSHTSIQATSQVIVAPTSSGASSSNAEDAKKSKSSGGTSSSSSSSSSSNSSSGSSSGSTEIVKMDSAANKAAAQKLRESMLGKRSASSASITEEEKEEKEEDDAANGTAVKESVIEGQVGVETAMNEAKKRSVPSSSSRKIVKCIGDADVSIAASASETLLSSEGNESKEMEEMEEMEKVVVVEEEVEGEGGLLEEEEEEDVVPDEEVPDDYVLDEAEAEAAGVSLHVPVPKAVLSAGTMSATHLKEELKKRIKAKEDSLIDKYKACLVDDVRLHEVGFKERYYNGPFKKENIEQGGGLQKMCFKYVEGLCWVLKYYYEGCPSWNWYYPFHYAPFASDLVNIDSYTIKFEKSKPFRPVEQLLAVLPKESVHALPASCQFLMTSESSPIYDLYGSDAPIDTNGKHLPWLWVLLLPFINEHRVVDAFNQVKSQMTLEERIRNSWGKPLLFIHRNHSLASLIHSAIKYAPGKEEDPEVLEALKADVEDGDGDGVGDGGGVASVAGNAKVGGDASAGAGAGDDDKLESVYFNGLQGNGVSGTVTRPPPRCFSPLDSLIPAPTHPPGAFFDLHQNQALTLSLAYPAFAPHESRLLDGVILPPPKLVSEDLVYRKPPRLSRGGINLLDIANRNRKFSNQNSYSNSFGGGAQHHPFQKMQYQHQQYQQSYSYNNNGRGGGGGGGGDWGGGRGGNGNAYMHQQQYHHHQQQQHQQQHFGRDFQHYQGSSYPPMQMQMHPSSQQPPHHMGHNNQYNYPPTFHMNKNGNGNSNGYGQPPPRHLPPPPLGHQGSGHAAMPPSYQQQQQQQQQQHSQSSYKHSHPSAQGPAHQHYQHGGGGAHHPPPPPPHSLPPHHSFSHPSHNTQQHAFARPAPPPQSHSFLATVQPPRPSAPNTAATMQSMRAQLAQTLMMHGQQPPPRFPPPSHPPSDPRNRR